MKHRPLLYIETSVFGFFFDEESGGCESARRVSGTTDQGD